MEDNTEPPVGTPITTDEKIFMLACHLSPWFGAALIVPLVIYLIKKDQPSRVSEHAKEALNFHISIAIYCLVSFVLIAILIGFLTLFAVLALAVVCSIIASIKAVDDRLYRYPLTLRLIK